VPCFFASQKSIVTGEATALRRAAVEMRQHLALHEKTKGARSDASGKGKKTLGPKLNRPFKPPPPPPRAGRKSLP
jgi:hypothetical protein